MAFRKRIKIAKGLHLNLSGSGFGIGHRIIPGLSFGLNKNGIYCYTSIPGTGFYSRHKITGSSLSAQTHQDSQFSELSLYPSHENKTMDVEIHIHANNDGSYTTQIYDEDGNIITNPFVENNVLNHRSYKEAVIRAINDCTNELVDIYKLTARPLTTIDMKKKVEEVSPIDSDEAARRLEKVKPIEIFPKEYDVKKPSYDDIKELLTNFAQDNISSVFFWTNKKKRDAFVNQRLESMYQQETKKWEIAKSNFDKQQAEYVNAEKIRMQEEYNSVLKDIENTNLEYEDAQKTLNGFINGDEKYINETIDHLLSCLKVPFKFAINYEFLSSKNILRIQLDLPEIEDFPKKKATLLSTEEISIKQKGVAECLKDYATSVCGMAFFFAGMMFNVSCKIMNIEVSAYTQRVNKTNGNEEDCYIYSVFFNRSHFAKINYSAIDPIEALKAQPNKSKILKSYEMREIIPFTEEEIIEIANNTEELPITPICDLAVKEKPKEESRPIIKDELTIDSAYYIINSQICSTSDIQRKFSIGFHRAGRIIEELETLGIVGKSNNHGARDVLVHNEEELASLLSQFGDKSNNEQ